MTGSPVSRAKLGVVGGGILGLAVAVQLTRALPDSIVTVFEKESHVAGHQTGHNSGVAHAGLYYLPGSLKATLCRRGVTLLKEYCTDRQLPFQEIGKLVVARNPVEVERLRELERRGHANGVSGLAWLDPAGMRELQPELAGQAALFSPTTAIVDFPAITRALATDLQAAGGRVLTGTEVTSVAPDSAGVSVRGGSTWHRLDRLVICAGLHSDRVSMLAGDGPSPAIVPFRGEYLRLRPEVRDRVRHLIYPVPDPAYPFLGVHFTPRVGGEVDIGPNAVLALAREGYRRGNISLDHLRELAASPGMRRLARAHWRTGAREMRGSLSRRAFLADARSYLPWLTLRDVVRAPSGVRAQAVDPNGTLVDDFRLGGDGPVLTVRNAPSPAATASLAIAEHVVDHLMASDPTGR